MTNDQDFKHIWQVPFIDRKCTGEEDDSEES